MKKREIFAGDKFITKFDQMITVEFVDYKTKELRYTFHAISKMYDSTIDSFFEAIKKRWIPFNLEP